jgi:hypothetical protein
MRRLLVFVSAALLTACATATPPSQVTRFHRLEAATPLLPFYIATPDNEADGGVSGPEWNAYASAVASALERYGYRCALPGSSGCVLPANSGFAPAPSVSHRVVVRFDRAAAGSRRGGSGVNIGVGGSTGSYGSGVGVGVGVDITRLLGGGAPDILLRLSVRINDEYGQAVWEGRAETAVRSGTPAAQPGIAAARLTDALFTGFPGRSGETISVL